MDFVVTSSLAWVLSVCLLGSLISIGAAGAYLLLPKLLRDKTLDYLICFAIGMLLGASFLHLLPEAIELEQRPDLVAGNLGKRALEGYIAFSLANGRFASDEVVAAYVVVMELSTGSIVATRVGEQYALASDADGWALSPAARGPPP